MTLEEAKELYMKYDCSPYAMAMGEEGDTNYRKMNISKKQEEEWEDELFASFLKQLQESRNFRIFNRMYELATNQKTRQQLYTLKDALGIINYETPKIRACVAETILGRKEISQRSGMVFWAYDSGEREMAVELLHYVANLLKVSNPSEEIRKRVEYDMNTARLIDSELGLGVFA